MLAAAALLFAVIFAGGIWKFWPVEPPPAKPSIAVLPFDNLGGDEATGRLADGLTEDIITDLARFRDLDVIARNSTEVYKGKPVDVRQVGRDLNVRYVLEGSIQRQADRGAGHGAADRRATLAPRLVAIAGTARSATSSPCRRSWPNASPLDSGECYPGPTVAAAHRKPPEDLEAYDLVLLAYEAQKRGTRADIEQGLAYVDAAIARDPAFARSYTRKAWLLLNLPDPDKDYNATYAEMERHRAKSSRTRSGNTQARASTARALD